MTLYGTGSNPKTELLINGVWTDFSNRPRDEQKIVITRGRANEQAQVTAQTCQTTLNNRDGVMSNRNPSSPYYGLLPRNTNLRITAGGVSSADTYLKMLYTDAPNDSILLRNVSTADKAVLDITGDLDVRCEVQPYTWRPGLNTGLASKYQITGNQRSWFFYLRIDGTLAFVWTTDGTSATRSTVVSTVPVPVTSGRLAVRATIDVNNGAAGNTVAFYTASAIGGTYTQLGASVITAGVTSIFSGSADLVLGAADDFQRISGTDVNGSLLIGFGGRYFKGELWNGIAGTRVANMDATSRSIGDTSWSDGLGTPNTWTLTVASTGVRITSDRIRFTGELSSLPQVWDKPGVDVTVPITASGLLRRLTQGANPLNSPMYRNFIQYSPAGCWMLEDGDSATQAGSFVDGAAPAIATAVTFGADNAGLPGAASVAQFQDSTSRLQFSCPRVTSTGTISWVFYTRLSALPSTSKVLATLYTSGTAAQVRVALSATTWDITFLDASGSTLATGSTGVTSIDPSKGWVGYNLLLQTSGADMTFSIRWDAISAFGGGVGPTTITSAKVGVPTGGYTNSVADVAFTDAKMSSWFFSTTNLDLTNDSFRKASSAWTNETAGDRLIRLAREENQPIEVTGLTSLSEPMGPQLIDTFVANVYDCAAVDGGILAECRDRLALSYRTRVSMENRADVTFDYAQSHLSDVPLPTEDDQAFTNDVTVTRSSGSSARSQRLDGPTQVADPPVGVGRYATAPTRNAATDARLPSIAGWEMLVGSWDDARYPTLPVGLHRTEIQNSSSLTAQVMALDVGDTATLTNLPSWLPPDDVLELLQGYRETLDKFTWSVVYNATPAGPYLVPVVGADVPVRADATTHSLGGTMTTTATSVTFVTATGSARWVDTTNYPAEFPFNIKVAGEVMTVTAISGTSSPQTATVTRSVNGVVKSHVAGELVRLAIPYYVGR